MTFWGGAVRGATAGAVGGALSMVGGSTFAANIAWGIAEGGITGGFTNALFGEDIGKGMLSGAIMGGAFATVTSGYEAFKNLKDYDKFGTDVGIFNKMTNDVQNAFLNNNSSDYMSALKDLNTFTSDRFGFSTNFSGGIKSVSSLDGEKLQSEFLIKLLLKMVL